MTFRNRLSWAAATGLLLVLAAGSVTAADPAPAGRIIDAAPAVMRVTLPADAKLTIDGDLTKSTSADRMFVTPPLEPGQDFHYTLKAEFVRGEQTVTVEQRVAVRAGRETAVSLYPPGASALGGGPSRAGDQAFYYSPGQPAAGPYIQVRPLPRYYPISPPDDGNIGGARNNWKPDFSDPFLRGPG